MQVVDGYPMTQRVTVPVAVDRSLRRSVPVGSTVTYSRLDPLLFSTRLNGNGEILNVEPPTRRTIVPRGTSAQRISTTRVSSAGPRTSTSRVSRRTVSPVSIPHGDGNVQLDVDDVDTSSIVRTQTRIPASSIPTELVTGDGPSGVKLTTYATPYEVKVGEPLVVEETDTLIEKPVAEPVFEEVPTFVEEVPLQRTSFRRVEEEVPFVADEAPQRTMTTRGRLNASRGVTQFGSPDREYVFEAGDDDWLERALTILSSAPNESILILKKDTEGNIIRRIRYSVLENGM